MRIIIIFLTKSLTYFTLKGIISVLQVIIMSASNQNFSDGFPRDPHEVLEFIDESIFQEFLGPKDEWLEWLSLASQENIDEFVNTVHDLWIEKNQKEQVVPVAQVVAPVEIEKPLVEPTEVKQEVKVEPKVENKIDQKPEEKIVTPVTPSTNIPTQSVAGLENKDDEDKIKEVTAKSTTSDSFADNPSNNTSTSSSNLVESNSPIVKAEIKTPVNPFAEEPKVETPTIDENLTVKNENRNQGNNSQQSNSQINTQQNSQSTAPLTSQTQTTSQGTSQSSNQNSDQSNSSRTRNNNESTRNEQRTDSRSDSRNETRNENRNEVKSNSRADTRSDSRSESRNDNRNDQRGDNRSQGSNQNTNQSGSTSSETNQGRNNNSSSNSQSSSNQRATNIETPVSQNNKQQTMSRNNDNANSNDDGKSIAVQKDESLTMDYKSFDIKKVRETATKNELDVVYKDYLHSKDKYSSAEKVYFESQSALFDKLMGIVVNFEQVADYFESMTEKLLDMNDKIITQGRDLQSFKSSFVAKNQDLDDKVQLQESDTQRLERDLRDTKSLNSRRYQELAELTSRINNDSFGDEVTMKQRLDLIDAKIAKLNNQMGTSKIASLSSLTSKEIKDEAKKKSNDK